MTSSLSLPPRPIADDHWKFLRDVLVFQLKMLLDNARDFALMPVSLFAALIDFIFKGDRPGKLFYQVLRWGAHSERMINVYSAIEGEGSDQAAVNPTYTVDAVVAQIEEVLVRECAKGGTAANVKAAMEQALNQIHKGTSGSQVRAREAVARAADKWRGKTESSDPK